MLNVLCSAVILPSYSKRIKNIMRIKIIDTSNALPLIAILRGISPENVLQVSGVLIEQGFTSIEVPLNSPSALTSIEMLINEYGSQYLIGAGTVTTPELARAVIKKGANLIVSPNLNSEVITMALEAGCDCYPGVITPTEAFTALALGATGLKLFPISMLGINGFVALKSVLPAGTKCYPVGGINASVESMHPYLKAGAAGFGLGSALFTPSSTLEQIELNAKAFVDTYNSFNG